jgi:hypothetical protein
MGLGLLVLPGTIAGGVWKVCSHLLVAQQKNAQRQVPSSEPRSKDGDSELYVFSAREFCFKKFEVEHEIKLWRPVPLEYLEKEGL